MKSIAVFITGTTAVVSAFVPTPQSNFAVRNSVVRQMGLFDGMKEAFSAPALEKSTLDSERETPIDRWMGWNVQSTDETSQQQSAPVFSGDFVDSMDATNYISTSLQKPMGIVFEENDEDFGGIFVYNLKEGGAAEKDGVIKPGDQLISVDDLKVAGMPFDDALGALVLTEGPDTKLIFFRGTQKQLYGPTGASKEWLDEFIAKGGSEAST